jgi:hypothetical protein
MISWGYLTNLSTSFVNLLTKVKKPFHIQQQCSHFVSGPEPRPWAANSPGLNLFTRDPSKG